MQHTSIRAAASNKIMLNTQVLVTERLYLRRETYFAILMDRESAGPVLVGSPAGGMNIGKPLFRFDCCVSFFANLTTLNWMYSEDVAAETPHLIHKVAVDINKGPVEEEVRSL